MSRVHRNSPIPNVLKRATLPASTLGLLVSALAGTARAEEVSADAKAAARELATAGIAEAKAGNCESAIPKLDRAERLYHAPTILAALGECQIKLGKLVEGTENLKRVTLERLDASASSSFFDAQKRAASLLNETLPKIAKLTISLAPESAQDLVVSIDGAPIQHELLGIARPTDPGEHSVHASATGFLEAEAKVLLEAGEQETLTLELTPDPNYRPEEPAIAAPVAPATPAGPAPPPATEPPKKSLQPIFGWIGIGLGGAALAAGGVTGGLAMGEANQLDCPGSMCSGSDADRLDRANDLALASTILFGAGGALALTGVVLLVTSPSSTSTSAQAPSFKLSTVELYPAVHPMGLSVTARY